MNDLERYLNRATRGLWGRRRAEVSTELRGSLEARVWALEAQGRSRDEALSIALRELGRPEAISLGLLEVHVVNGTRPVSVTIPGVLTLALGVLLLVDLTTIGVPFLTRLHEYHSTPQALAQVTTTYLTRTVAYLAIILASVLLLRLRRASLLVFALAAAVALASGWLGGLPPFSTLAVLLGVPAAGLLVAVAHRRQLA